MKIKSILTGVLAIGLVVVTGCEIGEDEEKVFLTNTGTITESNQSRDGALKEFKTSNGNIVRFTRSTSIRRQRSSCSGFNFASASDIEIGDTITYSYDMDEADYAKRTYTAVEVDVFIADCN